MPFPTPQQTRFRHCTLYNNERDLSGERFINTAMVFLWQVNGKSTFEICLLLVCMCFVNLRFVCCSRRHRRYLHRWSNNFKLEPLTWKAPFVFLLTPPNDCMFSANCCETLFLDLWAIVDAEHRQLDAVWAKRLDVGIVDEADSVHVDHPQVWRCALQRPGYCPWLVAQLDDLCQSYRDVCLDHLFRHPDNSEIVCTCILPHPKLL